MPVYVDHMRAMAEAIGVQMRHHQYQGTYKSHFGIALSKRRLRRWFGAGESPQRLAS